MYSSHSILECYDLFSGVKLSIRSFCFIIDRFDKKLDRLFCCFFIIRFYFIQKG